MTNAGRALALTLVMGAIAGCGAKPLSATLAAGGHLGAKAAGLVATVETISGGHSPADAGYAVNVPAAQARYQLPNGLTYANGRLYVSDARNNVVTMLADQGGQLFASSFVGNPAVKQDQDGQGAQATFADPQDVATGPEGNLYLVEYHSDAVRSISPDGNVHTLLPPVEKPVMWGPYGIAAASGGTLYVTDLDRKQLVKLARQHDGSYQQTVLYRAKTDADPVPMGVAVDEQEHVFWSSGYGLYEMNKDGSNRQQLVSHFPKFAWDLAYRDGHLAVADLTCVLDVDLATRQVTTLAGNNTQACADGVGADASFGNACSITWGEPNTLYVADADNKRICRLTIGQR